MNKFSKMNKYYIIFLVFIAFSCSKNTESKPVTGKKTEINIPNTSIVILGTAQDAGSPQIACEKECCKNLFENTNNERQIVSLGLIDSENHKTYLFEATPNIGKQMKMITKYEPNSTKEFVDGIFLTHAHIGHYTGLMYLGKEAMDANNIPLYVMPRMKNFLSKNGPWNQLISRKNVQIQELKNEQAVNLSKTIKVTPILVPHRDEYSETVGYRINGPKKSALFIPDIDKWNKWDKNIVDEIKKVDYAFLDAAFYSGKEINNRDISEIPHPFVIESFETFKNLSKTEKEKIIFIHFNHTNPLLNPESQEAKTVSNKGYKVGKINSVFEL